MRDICLKRLMLISGNGKNLVVSLLLWLFLGYGIGGHNFHPPVS